MNFMNTTMAFLLFLILAIQNLSAAESATYSSEEYTSSSSETLSQTSSRYSRSNVNVKIKLKDFDFLKSYIPNEIYQQCYEEFLKNDFVYVNNRAYELRSGKKIKKDGPINCEKSTDALPSTYRNRDRKHPLFVKSIEANLTSEILYLNYFYNDEWYSCNGRQWGFQVSTQIDPVHVKDIKEAFGLETPEEQTTTITKTVTSTQEFGVEQHPSDYGQLPYATQPLIPQYAIQTLNPQVSYSQQPYATQTFNQQLCYGQPPCVTQTITPQYGQYMMSNTQFCQSNNSYQR